MSLTSTLRALLTELSGELTLVEAGQRVRAIADDLRASAPLGLKVSGHIGRGRLTPTPWLGIFNPDISVRPRQGLYVALIRHPDSTTATLTVQQGSDDLRAEVGAEEARERLSLRASRIRAAIALKEPPLDQFHFGAGTRQRAYAAGSVAAKTYELEAMPTEDRLAGDLRSMLRILDGAWEVLSDATGAEWVNSDLDSANGLPLPDKLRRFVPKNSDDYTVELDARTLTKSRLHEAVVNDLEDHARGLGWTVTSEHPIDLVLRRSDVRGRAQLIVEVKTVYGGRPVDAVRAAIGQLLTYRFQQFPAAERSGTDLVAAFSEDVGSSLRELLSDELGVAVLWLDGHAWKGCQRATEQGLIARG